MAAVAVAMLASSPAAASVERPKLLWEGELHGIQDLIVHGNRVDVETQAGSEMSHVTYRFLKKLPELDLDASVHLLSSRGYVHITQQPEFKNGYTLRVRIEDRQDGTYLYRLAIDWPDMDLHGQRPLKSMGEKPKKPKRHAADVESWAVNGEPIKVSCRKIWQGEIEGTVQLAVTGEEVRVISGTAKGNLQSQGDQRPLKDAKSVAVISLSPDIATRILETPARGNEYTFKIEVSGGDGPASIELAW